MDAKQLEQLRPLGKLESVSSACHHLGFYNNVGLSAHYKFPETSTELDLRQVIYTAVAGVLEKHSILSAVPIDEATPNPYFARLPSIDLERSVTFIERHQPQTSEEGTEDIELDALLQDQANTNFKLDYGNLPFWRLIILQASKSRNEFTACFIFHHAIGDGISGLAFHSSFLTAIRSTSLTASINSKPDHIVKSNQNALLPPLEDLHPLPLPDTVAAPTPSALKEWTGGIIHVPCTTRFKSLAVSSSSSKRFIDACKQNSLTLTAVLPSLIATTLFSDLPEDTEALTCIIPVSLRTWLAHDIVDGAIGTWIDAFKVKLLRQNTASNAQSTNIWPQAHETAKEITEYLTHTSPTGEPYTTIALFQGIPDVSVIFNSTLGKPRDAAFELSNLGLFSCPESTSAGAEPVWQVGKVTFSRSAVVSGSALTVNAVTGGDGRLTLGFTWQDGVVEDSIVDQVVGGVRKYFES